MLLTLNPNFWSSPEININKAKENPYINDKNKSYNLTITMHSNLIYL